ncbi:hypothetical protein H6P81_007075 [Aristolochia fimbriata]|uniref:Uncharacterized protein n=1 Tax=Aristolochia fimbriata TaxID=158543 RepID=A0AAV7F2V1_ARIFI|nr:hypothetical protein H6P81_007075 [Aristolochia fimbriata]
MASVMCLNNHFSVQIPSLKNLKTDQIHFIQRPILSSRPSFSNSSRTSATSPGKLLSISLTAPSFTSNPKIPGNLVVGTAFLSLMLSALVSTLKLVRERGSLPSRSSLIRYRFESSRDFRDVDIYNLKKKFLMDLRLYNASSSRELGNEKLAIMREPNFRPVPFARGDCDFALEVPERALNSGTIEPSFPIEVPIFRETLGYRQFQSLMVWEFYVMEGRKAENIAGMHIGTGRLDICNLEEEEKDMLNVNDSGDRRFFLPQTSVAPLEILPSRIEEKDELLASNEVQAAMPAITMAAGVLGALVAGDSGFLEMVGVVAITSFVVYDLLLASRRKMLWKDLELVTDRDKFVHFLLSRKIITTVHF